jgi:hypothetical protein
MSADQYLLRILAKYTPNTAGAQAQVNLIYPAIQKWAGQYLIEAIYSGSIAKGTAVSLSSDADVFISLSSNTPDDLSNIYSTLFNALRGAGFLSQKQNVSIHVSAGGYKIDFTPGKRQSQYGYDHSLYSYRAQTWTKTNVKTHIDHASASGRLNEIRLVKIWRSLRGLDFPSFYLELAVIDCLKGSGGTFSDNVWKALGFLATAFPSARYVDPANTNNIISDDLSQSEKQTVQTTAQLSIKETAWENIIW